jgi:cell division protein ZapA
VPADHTPITIRVLEKEYTVGCPADEREALLQAAQYLDRKMREMRDGGRVIGLERIAVITALNLAHELLQDKRDRDTFNDTVVDSVRRMTGKIELALRGDSAGQTV